MLEKFFNGFLYVVGVVMFGVMCMAMLMMFITIFGIVYGSIVKYLL